MAFLSDNENLNSKYATFDEIEQFIGNRLWNWGRNTYGEVGDNTITSRSSPVQTISAGTNWSSTSSGQLHTGGIKTDGTLWLWGRNNYGQLGDNTATNKSSPVQTVAAGTNWKSLCLSFLASGAIKTDGTLWLWGKNNYGEVGDNTSGTHRSSPVQTVSGGTNWKSISGGQNHFAALKTDGTLWLWGYGAFGQLGDNTATSKSSPIQTVAGGTNWKSAVAGQVSSAGIKTDGTLWLWGNNASGTLGDGTTTVRSSPVQTICAGTNWKQVTVSAAPAAIKTDGTLWLWGANSYGQLGDGTVTPKSSPIQTVAGGTNWKQVQTFALCTAAIKTDGTLWLWGRNNYGGTLGDGTIISASSPVQTVAGGTNWMSIGPSGGYTVSAITFSDSQ